MTRPRYDTDYINDLLGIDTEAMRLPHDKESLVLGAVAAARQDKTRTGDQKAKAIAKMFGVPVEAVRWRL